ncbi:MAG: GPR endopeptidase [Lachnospiraceae bacterium]|nr:GPR endopeptidase [Lachnospiraceae bacterium]MDD7177034.1 GPR endopeptidase [bacterium]MDY5517054.1 GPR endopeptidase [Lachnospiraceae bacterium]
MYEIRTDLALEAREKYEQDNVEIKGVRLEKEKMCEDMQITTMVIETENGARSMGRPKGNYITIEAASMDDEDDRYHHMISEQLARVIKRLAPKGKQLSALVVGLGNREVTSDSLGPKVADQLFITRHMMREFGDDVFGNKQRRVSAIVPGVMAQTGMESSEIIRGILRETQPDFVIAVDALAARSTKRLNRTIQITDTGIHPGSGVGNHRHPLTKEALGIPVLAIGIPTVVDAATIVNDTMNNLLEALAEHAPYGRMRSSYRSLDEVEQYELVRELLAPQLNTLYVTSKDIDASVNRLSTTISEAINLALKE